MMYYFRVTENLINKTVARSYSMLVAQQCIRQDKLSIFTNSIANAKYAEILGKQKYPSSGEIVKI